MSWITAGIIAYFVVGFVSVFIAMIYDEDFKVSDIPMWITLSLLWPITFMVVGFEWLEENHNRVLIKKRGT